MRINFLYISLVMVPYKVILNSPHLFFFFFFLLRKYPSPFLGGFPSFYSLFTCIPALHMYVSGHFLGYLSHQDLSRGGRRLEVVGEVVSCEVTV